MRHGIVAASLLLGGCLAGAGNFDWYDTGQHGAASASLGRMPPAPTHTGPSPSGAPISTLR